MRDVDFEETHITNDRFEFKIFESERIVGRALVKRMHDMTKDYWHLDDLQIDKESRGKGYGTALVRHLMNHLSEISELPMRVHPAGVQQVMEDLFEARPDLCDEEHEEQLRQAKQDMQDPSYWETQQRNQVTFNSDGLKGWYRKRGFNVDDSDGRHLWHLPESST
jgi:GNAT superfamily N-acetyltransferase